MRYNNFKNDPNSNGQPNWAIASREDLSEDPNKRSFNGATDCKITSKKRLDQGQGVIAQSGPTHDQQPYFSWANVTNHSHIGQPDLFNFEWVEMINYLEFIDASA